jgi:hypothetical protein
MIKYICDRCSGEAVEEFPEHDGFSLPDGWGKGPHKTHLCVNCLAEYRADQAEADATAKAARQAAMIAAGWGK